MVKLSAQLAGVRETRTQRVLRQQQQQQKQTQQESNNLREQAQRISDTEFSNLSSVEEYRQKYNQLPSNLKQFFQTPQQVEARQVQQFAPSEKRYNELISKYKQRATEAGRSGKYTKEAEYEGLVRGLQEARSSKIPIEQGFSYARRVAKGERVQAEAQTTQRGSSSLFLGRGGKESVAVTYTPGLPPSTKVIDPGLSGTPGLKPLQPSAREETIKVKKAPSLSLQTQAKTPSFLSIPDVLTNAGAKRISPQSYQDLSPTEKEGIEIAKDVTGGAFFGDQETALSSEEILEARRKAASEISKANIFGFEPILGFNPLSEAIGSTEAGARLQEFNAILNFPAAYRFGKRTREETKRTGESISPAIEELEQASLELGETQRGSSSLYPQPTFSEQTQNLTKDIEKYESEVEKFNAKVEAGDVSESEFQREYSNFARRRQELTIGQGELSSKFDVYQTKFKDVEERLGEQGFSIEADDSGAIKFVDTKTGKERRISAQSAKVLAASTTSEQLAELGGRTAISFAKLYVLGAGLGATGVLAKVGSGGAELTQALKISPKIAKISGIAGINILGLGASGVSAYSGYKAGEPEGVGIQLAAVKASETAGGFLGFGLGAKTGTEIYRTNQERALEKQIEKINNQIREGRIYDKGKRIDITQQGTRELDLKKFKTKIRTEDLLEERYLGTSGRGGGSGRIKITSSGDLKIEGKPFVAYVRQGGNIRLKVYAPELAKGRLLYKESTYLIQQKSVPLYTKPTGRLVVDGTQVSAGKADVKNILDQVKLLETRYVTPGQVPASYQTAFGKEFVSSTGRVIKNPFTIKEFNLAQPYKFGLSQQQITDLTFTKIFQRPGFITSLTSPGAGVPVSYFEPTGKQKTISYLAQFAADKRATLQILPQISAQTSGSNLQLLRQISVPITGTQTLTTIPTSLLVSQQVSAQVGGLSSAGTKVGIAGLSVASILSQENRLINSQVKALSYSPKQITSPIAQQISQINQEVAQSTQQTNKQITDLVTEQITETTTTTTTTPTTPILPSAPIPPSPGFGFPFILPGGGGGRKKKKKKRGILEGYLPSFTALALGLEPVEVTQAEAERLVKQALSGVQPRRSVRLVRQRRPTRKRAKPVKRIKRIKKVRRPKRK